MPTLNSSIAGPLEIREVSKRYGGLIAAEQVSFQVNRGELVALLGPSGSGKSTLGEIIAGALKLDSGKVLLDGQDISDLPAHKRGISLAPQEWELFSHLTAAQNIGFGPWAFGQKRSSRARLEQEWLRRIRLPGRGSSLPHQLSGGEQQRVSVARALAAPGGFAVLDEPFANVDQETRVALREVVREEIVKERGVLLITHDQNDALRLAHRVVCMRKGRILMVGTPEDVYWRPSSLDAALLIGDASFVLLQEWSKESLRKVLSAVPEEYEEGRFDSDDAGFVVRPEWLEVVADGTGALTGVVESVSFAGIGYLTTVALERGSVKVMTDAELSPGRKISVGVRAGIGLKLGVAERLAEGANMPEVTRYTPGT